MFSLPSLVFSIEKVFKPILKFILLDDSCFTLEKNGFYPSFSELKHYLRNRKKKNPANFKFIILSQIKKKY